MKKSNYSLYYGWMYKSGWKHYSIHFLLTDLPGCHSFYQLKNKFSLAAHHSMILKSHILFSNISRLTCKKLVELKHFWGACFHRHGGEDGGRTPPPSPSLTPRWQRGEARSGPPQLTCGDSRRPSDEHRATDTMPARRPAPSISGVQVAPYHVSAIWNPLKW